MDILNITNILRKNAENETLYRSISFYGIGVFSIFIFIFGLLENVCVLCVFVKYKPIPISNNICIIWLTLVDLSQTILGVPFLIGSSFAERWPYGHSVCVFYGFIMTFFGISQIAILAITAIDKYLIIVKQNQILSKDLKLGIISITCCFGFGLIWASLPILGWSSFKLEGLKISCSVNWAGRTLLDMSYSLSLMVFAWIIPVMVILFCYGNILLLVS